MQAQENTFVLEVSIRDTRRAHEILEDARMLFENDGTNLFLFECEDTAYDASEMLRMSAVEFTQLDHNR